MPAGYYRYPTIHADSIVFVCEDDLWSVSADGGIARRLTSNLGAVTRPSLSRDGALLAFVGKEEGQAEIYVSPASGGPTRRLTYMGGSLCQTAGWTQDGLIIFASNAAQPFPNLLHLYTLNPSSGLTEPVNIGPARAISFGPQGGVVIGRNTGEPAHWKRYRGGTAGQLWIDESGQGEFRPLIKLNGNLGSPMWLDWETPGGRIFFISDHEGVGNLYSCLPSGEDLRRHTDHEDFYARNPSTDGRRIVYHAGADLYLYDLASDRSAAISIEFYSPQTQRNRKFVDAARYLTGWDIHPRGRSLAINTRGKVFTFSNWEGAVMQHGDEQVTASDGAPANGAPADGAARTGIRYRLPHWLHDGKRLIAVTDTGGEETFILWNADGSGEAVRLPDLDTGRTEAIAVNPWKDQIVFSNHRYELHFLDLETRELRLIDRGKVSGIAGFDWSPDGEWVAYSVSQSLQRSGLKLWKASSGEVFPLTNPVLKDVAPAFDPQGRYIYFLSYRSFDPVYDNLHFDLNFPRGMRPYLVTLRKDLPSPFIPRPKGDEEAASRPEPEGKNGGAPQPADAATSGAEGADEAPKAEVAREKIPLLQIDLEGIQDRVVAFPVQDGIYGRVRGAKDDPSKNGRVLYTRFPIEGALSQQRTEPGPPAKGTLLVYSFEEQKEDVLVYGVSDFGLTPDGETLIYNAGGRLRVLKAGEMPNGNGEGPGRKSGWINLGRVKVSVMPGSEWRQMFREAWRLQRDQFWTPDMSQVDWLSIHDRYLPLVDRASSRSEFSDLMWEMQGELGTSHAYESGGDYRPEPDYTQGSLGARFEFDPQTEAWTIIHIAQGDAWDPRSNSPLRGPGVNVSPGDRLLAVNGRRLSRDLSPSAALVNLAGEEVTLTVQPAVEELSITSGQGPDGPSPDGPTTADGRTVTVRTLADDSAAYYREWVEKNRQRVHQASGGRAGYIHIPDMMARGYAEFHRGYLAEVEREGLVVDVRFNRGGHVSALLLEKLARRRIGYDTSRWGQMPEPYPPESVLGPMVALTNENAGSDGDIFSHGFKLMKLGPLIGKRTWGGVIGINPSHALVDGAMTTQPEYSFWFEDVGWGVENYGTDPDIEVDNLPQDYARGVDTQLERAITEILRLLEANPPRLPEFTSPPSRAVPRLPKR